MKITRFILKNLEFQLPVWLSSPILRSIYSEKNPYEKPNEKLKSIFIHIPKTAGRSIHQAIFGDESNHIPLARYKAYNTDKFESYFKFCFTLNPYGRMYSAFSNLVKMVGDKSHRDARMATKYLRNIDSFESFIKKLGEDYIYRSQILQYTHFIPQYKWVCLPPNNEPEMDFIGRFENLQSDFNEVIKRLDIDTSLPTIGKRSKTKSYKEVYTQEMLSIVGDIYQEDFRYFDYNFK